MRIIIDRHKRLGNKPNKGFAPSYGTDLNKEEVTRNYILNDLPGQSLNFLDVGGRDGELKYLLGIIGNLDFDQSFYNQNKKLFETKYNYFGLDLEPSPDNTKILFGDVCENDFLEKWNSYVDYFDVIYSNNVFEHLANPFKAAENLSKLCKKDGSIVTIVPFSQRYHAVPNDYFRYTHTAISKIFSNYGTFEEIICGYDIKARRNDWQGVGSYNDFVPEDNFGAWRETWFTVSILKKIH